MCISWLLLIMLLSMHGSTMKFSNAQQEKIINNYQNTRLKLLKTKAAIWFNRMCKIKQGVLFYTADSTHNGFPYAATMPTIWARSMNL
jgi:hypothetical protein